MNGGGNASRRRVGKEGAMDEMKLHRFPGSEKVTDNLETSDGQTS